MYCKITQKKFQDVMSLVDAAVVPVALLWVLHTSGCDSTMTVVPVHMKYFNLYI